MNTGLIVIIYHPITHLKLSDRFIYLHFLSKKSKCEKINQRGLFNSYAFCVFIQCPSIDIFSFITGTFITANIIDSFKFTPSFCYRSLPRLIYLCQFNIRITVFLDACGFDCLLQFHCSLFCIVQFFIIVVYKYQLLKVFIIMTKKPNSMIFTIIII